MSHFHHTFVSFLLINGVLFSSGSKNILNEILTRNRRMTNEFYEKLTNHQKRFYDSLSHRFRIHQSWNLFKRESHAVKKFLGRDDKPIFQEYREFMKGILKSEMFCNPPNPCPPEDFLPGAKDCLKDYPKDDMKNFSKTWMLSYKIEDCDCDSNRNKFCLSKIIAD